MDASNWGGTAPVAGDDLVFPAAALNTTNVNDFTAGTLFHSIAFADAYTVSGNAITLGAGGLTFTPAAAASLTIALDVTIQVGQLWTSTPANARVFETAALHLQQGAAATLQIAVDGEFDALGTIDGTGKLEKLGPGDLVLSGVNTYAGSTLISEGRIVATTDKALGVADGNAPNGTVVSHTGALAGSLTLRGVAIGNEAITLNSLGINGNGALQVDGGLPSSIDGPITLASDAAVNLNGAASTLTVTGRISGPGQLGLGNDGTLLRHPARIDDRHHIHRHDHRRRGHQSVG